jgi:spore coat polysaccharide biosynthesis protein SpsF
MALKRLGFDNPTAIEINAKAAEKCRQNVPGVEVLCQSILDFRPKHTWDLVFTYGVLIHMPPDKLPEVYDLMYRASARYVLLAEYYSPKPVEIPYRGHAGKLFKRDFAGELMDRHPDLTLLDYGFVYHRDPAFPADDVTWFLLSK